MIVKGTDWEVNQWLEWAGWDKYLANVKVNKLLDCVAASDEETEQELWMIWQGMDRMVQECQNTVVSWAELYIWFKAIQTEKHQTWYTSLKGYMDCKAVVKHAQLWKQILMFIGRTQGEQEWRKPKYKLKKEQKKAWKHLWQVAGTEYMWSQRVIDKKSREEFDDHLEQDKPQLNELLHTCLDFCFTLLQKQYLKSEYSNVLVCELAVLGVWISESQWGWMSSDNYLFILLKMIKIVHFMIIEQAFQKWEQDISDSSSDSELSLLNTDSELKHEKRPECLKLVWKYMNKFMIWETNRVMQWMLNLQTYKLKIYYNTTAEEFIDWVEEQISWKSLVQFIMKQLHKMIEKLIQESKEVLFYNLMLIKSEVKIPVILWSSLRDNSQNEEISWNYLQNEHNI